MKKVNLTGFGLAAALLLAASCDDGLDFTGGTGTVAPLVDYDPTVISARSASRAAEIGDLTKADLTLTLASADGSVNESFPCNSFPTDRGFKTGKYTLTASYGDPDAEGFELPAVSGSAELSVTEGKQTRVDLTATPSKAMVTVRFDESVSNYMDSWSARLHTPGGAYIDYSATETRPVYLRPGSVELSVSFVKPNGKSGTVVAANFEASARTHHTITLSLAGDGSGVIEQLVVSYDETLTEEDVLIDISDQVLSIPAPVVTPVGFTDGQLFNSVEGSAMAVRPRFEILARGGISKAVLTTSCPSLIEKGWPEEIDLANCPAATQQTLVDLGLKDVGLFRNPGNVAAVDLGDVSAHIAASSTDAAPSEFTLVVTDKQGKTSNPLGFKVKVDKLELNIATATEAYDGSSTVDVTVDYNGTSPLSDAVKFQYQNRNGIFADAPVANVSALSRALPQYLVTLSIGADAKAPLTIRATCGTIESPQLLIPTAPVLSVNSNDVFARSAWVALSSEEADFDCAGKTIELYGSTNGTDFTKLTGTQSGAEFHITGGLEPATTYTLRATVGGMNSRIATITTEAATQIANSDFNDGWNNNEHATWGAYKAEITGCPTPWANINKATVHIGGANKGGINSCQKSTDGRNGSACALLYTVNHGALATAFSKPDKFDFGEMFLGNYNNGAQRGIDFVSRPSAIKFWCKYIPYLSTEKGVAEIKVLDAGGNVIATATKLVDAVNDWAVQTASLTYAHGASKAARLEINFKSSNAADAKSACRAPEIGKFVTGAAFFIDDIELVY